MGKQEEQSEKDYDDKFYDDLDNMDLKGMNNDIDDYGGGFGMQNGQMSDQNLIEWQLDFKQDLQEIRMYLSGYKEGYDEKGNWTFLPPKEGEEVPFNDYGVNVIMGHIRCYLNRNTVLSNYGEKRIRKILFDLGNRLGDEIEMTYEILGMDTEHKRKKFPLIILNILHMTESAYNRALSGGERESLRTARQVTQTEPLGGGNNGMGNQQMSKRNKFRLMKPRTWGG